MIDSRSISQKLLIGFGVILSVIATILVTDGRPVADRLDKTRVGLDDIMEAARQNGVMELSEIRYAILENSGAISIIRQRTA